MQFQSSPEKCMSIYSDSQAALKALQPIRTSPLVQQCQKALNDTSTRLAVDCVGSLDMLGYKIMRSVTSLQGTALFYSLVDLSQPWESRQDIQRRIRHWLVDQHRIWWRGLGDTQRQAWELISGPCLGAKARFLSFNRTQSRAVTGLLTGHNTLRKHVHLMRLSDSPLCRRCGAEDDLCPHSLWVWCFGFTQTCVSGLFFLEPEDIKSISLGAIWNFSKATGLPYIDMGHKGPIN